jgi:aldehyde:ferredoxin oxidoreductase
MAGWDENGHPTRTKLTELGLSWLADELEASRR